MTQKPALSIAIDFGPESLSAAKYAQNWGNGLKTSLEFIHVDLSMSHSPDTTLEQYTLFLKEFGHENSQPLNILTQGNLKNSFQEFFETHPHTQYLFVGARNHDFLNRMLIGSFTEKIVQLSPIPVVVCKNSIEHRPTSILVAMDFSTLSEKVVQTAKQLANAFNASMHLVHVVNTNIADYTGINHYFSDLSAFNLDKLVQLQMDKATNELSQWAKKVDCSSYEIHSTIDRNVGLVLNDYAAKNKHDLIIVGEHQRNFVDRMVLGHATLDLIRATEKNICIIK